VVTGLVFLFNFSKLPPVNRASQVMLRDLEPARIETFDGSCNWQLATRAVHNGASAGVAFGGGIFENFA